LLVRTCENILRSFRQPSYQNRRLGDKDANGPGLIPALPLVFVLFGMPLFLS
jgi:hypothetical protein